jgi:hypothetical protein
MATAQIPEGGTYLDTFKGSFTKVPIDAENGNAIATTEFLDAAESLTTMFGIVDFYTGKSEGQGS